MKVTLDLLQTRSALSEAYWKRGLGRELGGRGGAGEGKDDDVVRPERSLFLSMMPSKLALGV